MRDRRSEILARLPELFDDIPGIIAIYRNRDATYEKTRPSIIINDADEEADEQNVSQSVRRSSNIVRMTPEIFVSVSGCGEEVSTEINRIRCEIIKRVYADPVIKSVTGPNGDVHYGGCTTAMASGRRMEGEVVIMITFTYPLLLSEL